MVVEVEEETHILWKKCVYLKYIYQYLKHINTHSTRQTKVIRPTSYYSIQILNYGKTKFSQLDCYTLFSLY
jgi:hypothetical protein